MIRALTEARARRGGRGARPGAAARRRGRLRGRPRGRQDHLRPGHRARARRRRTPATSPTYALVHRYAGRRGPVFHLDCYRLRRPEEAADLDWEALLAEGDAVLIEWPERAGAWVPEPTMRFRLGHLDDPGRRSLEAD